MASATAAAPGADEAVWPRCFIALVPDRAARHAWSSLPVQAGARRVAADQLHMTLAFLGTIAEVKGRQLAAALPTVVLPLPPLVPRSLEYWPNPARPRLAALAFEHADALNLLASRVRALVSGLGLPVDDHRPFRPHVTLARMPRDTKPVAGTPRPPLAPVSFDDGYTFRFERLTLYASTLERSGARYRSLESVPVPAG